MKMRIGIDVSGGDNAPMSNITGALEASKELSHDIQLVLIGDKNQIRSSLQETGTKPDEYEIIHAPDCITMHDHPTQALKQKPQSSISVGFKLLKENYIDCFASAGNTGAMLVGSIYSVNNIPGVIRPCITSILPKLEGGFNIILDVGSNADCKPDVLYQFGLLGSIYSQHVYGINTPKVGLLNIGEEPEKGNLLAQAAHNLMKSNTDYNFIGNIEGRDIFRDKADVIVCDGFTGNIVLKEAEGIYWLMRKRGIHDEYFEKYNYEHYGGTPVLGVNSNVIIGHGISNAKAIKNMILLSRDVVKAQLPQKIKEAFSK